MPPVLYKTKQWIAAIDWLAVTRILTIQIIVLFALALAATRYLAWSSDIAGLEFARAIGPTASDPATRAPCPTPTDE